MEIIEIFQNEYFDKIILTLIPLILKGIFGNKEYSLKYANILMNYLLPIFTIFWINIDENIAFNKLTITLIGINFSFILFNYLNKNLTDQNKTISKFTDVETDKVKQINQINEVQVEKIKAINDNQKYILDELSKINDRIIKSIIDKNNVG